MIAEEVIPTFTSPPLFTFRCASAAQQAVAATVVSGIVDDTTGLKYTIREVMNQDANVRWTNPKMMSYLQNSGYPLKAKRPIYSIGQATNKLVEKGDIILVRKGAGNEPNVYRGLTEFERILQKEKTGGKK